jgi:ricin-type beta-trefoil lectin protein/pregnancy-associated plasma protein-A
MERKYRGTPGVRLVVAFPLLVKLVGVTGCGDVEQPEATTGDDTETVKNAVITTLPAFPYEHMPVEIRNVGSNKCLQVTEALTTVQATCDGSKQQAWSLIRSTGGYQLKSAHRVWENLDVPGGSSNDGLQLNVGGGDGPPASQIFRFDSTSSGNYRIKTFQDKCVEVANGSSADLAAVQQNPCLTSGNKQRWLPSRKTVNFGFVAKNSKMCMDVANASLSDNALVQQYPCVEGAPNERWYLESAGTTNGVDYFYIRSTNSGKCLDVPNGSTSTGIQLQQYSCIGVDNEKWSFSDQGDGRLRIKNKRSNLCVEVAGSSMEAHAAIQQGTCSSTASKQRWFYTHVVNRHLQAILVADDNGQNRTVAEKIEEHVADVAKVYQPYGVNLLFDPQTDVSTNFNSTLISEMTSGASVPGVCFGTSQLLTAQDCASFHVGDYGGKVVFYVIRGGGWAGVQNFIASLEIHGEEVCQSSDPKAAKVYNTRHWSHEFGHHLGLSHTFIGDGDRLTDTRVNNGGDDCAQPRISPATVNGVLTDTNNAMSYFYHVDRKITVSQAHIVRATSFTRFY